MLWASFVASGPVDISLKYKWKDDYLKRSNLEIHNQQPEEAPAEGFSFFLAISVSCRNIINLWTEKLAKMTQTTAENVFIVCR